MAENKPSGIAFRLVDIVTTLAFWRYVAAIVSGLLLSGAFPPLCWDLLAWVGLVPILFMPQPRSWVQRCLVGYVFGYAHFASCLPWLNEVGFGAGFLLAIYCALYPMIWYCFMCVLLQSMKELKADQLPGASFLYIKSQWKLAAVTLGGACSWVALEWLRGVVLTGFPWNQLGISQFERTGLIQIASFTGVYGVSFLIVVTNLALTVEAVNIAWMYLAHRRHPVPWHFLVLFALLIPVCICANLPKSLPNKETPRFDALVVQGNLPQQRIWTEQKLVDSIARYELLTEGAYNAAASKPDVVIWPEAAIPAPLNYEGFRNPRNAFIRKFDTQFLIGAVHHRFDPDNPENELVFNSAFLLDWREPATNKCFNPIDHIVDYYDKVHRVPFGEYTPMASIFPWLPGVIGMGRDLTPGRVFHPITLKNGAKLGVNICFEDVFPDISREFTLNGAQILATITNDSWYNESAGAHQHMSHVVFRAVENRRPFMRCGSNSHTCYITPNGDISPFLRDEKNDHDFIAGAQVYELPIHDDLGTTFYTRHGDVFAMLNLLASMMCLTWLVHRTLQEHRRRLNMMTEALKAQVAEQATSTVMSKKPGKKS